LAKTQDYPLSPPSEIDREILVDFSSILQRNLEELFEEAHSHDIITADPAESSGSLKDIKLVDDGTNKYLVIKFGDGWYKTANLTAV
jgi:hypothetical protein